MGTTYFFLQTVEIADRKILIWLQKRNVKRETEFLLKVVQNKAIRSSYAKVKIVNAPQNSKRRDRING